MSPLSINKKNNPTDTDLRPIHMGFAILDREDYWGYWLMIILEVGDLFWRARILLDTKVVDFLILQSNLPARRPLGCVSHWKLYSNRFLLLFLLLHGIL